MTIRRSRAQHARPASNTHVPTSLAVPVPVPFQRTGTAGRCPMNGPILYVLPEIREDWPAWVRQAIATRNVATTTGQCPGCGARYQQPNRAERRRLRGLVLHAAVHHEDGCPAIDPTALAWLRGAGWAG